MSALRLGTPWSLILAASAMPQSDTAPTLEAAEELVDQLDAALESGGIDAYDRLVTSLHPQVHAAQRAWFASLLACGAWRVESEILDFTSADRHGVALLATKLQPASRPDDPGAAVATTRYLAFRATPGGALATLDVEVAERELPELPLTTGRATRFGCRACNYSIHVDDGWLLVPHEPERTGVLEAISIYSLDHGISVDLSIHVPRDGPPPRQALTALLEARDCAAAGEIESWVPPSHRKPVPDGLVGARVRVVDASGWTTVLHAVRFGPVLYLIAAQGGAGDLERHGEALESVLAGFMLRETDPQVVDREVAPVANHTHGSVAGRVYSNDRLGIRFAGPEGWPAELCCGPHLCHVAFSCPESTGARVSLRALPPPFGNACWTTLNAGLSVDCAIDAGDLAVEDDTDWRDDDTGEQVRDLKVRTAGSFHAVRAVIGSDRKHLFLLEARARSRADLEPLLTHFDSFVR